MRGIIGRSWGAYPLPVQIGGSAYSFSSASQTAASCAPTSRYGLASAEPVRTSMRVAGPWSTTQRIATQRLSPPQFR